VCYVPNLHTKLLFFYKYYRYLNEHSSISYVGKSTFLCVLNTFIINYFYNSNNILKHILYNKIKKKKYQFIVILTQYGREHCLILKAFLSLIHFVVSLSSLNNCLSYSSKIESIHLI